MSAGPEISRDQDGPSARTAYVVLGMHRSGTSAVTKLLALGGAQLPKNVMPGDEHNAKGYFEPWRVAVFNDERLRAAGGAWDDPFGFPFRPLDRRADRKWLVRGEGLLVEEFGAARYPLLKDPRITLLLPFWRTLFEDIGVGVRCVIPVRNPLDVAASLQRRNGFTVEKSVLLWVSYMLAAEAYSRDLPRVFVEYDALLSDWRGEVARIEAAHAAPLPNLTEKSGRAIDRFLTPGLRHHATPWPEGGPALGWIGEIAHMVYGELLELAAGRPTDGARLEAAAGLLERRRRDIGDLVSPATRDTDALRAELRHAQALLDIEVGRLTREIADVRAAWKRDIAEVRAAWKRDTTEVRAAWKRDVTGLDKELGEFYSAMAAAQAMLDEALSKP